MRRFTRLTNAFSKKWESHWAAVALWYCWYTFGRVHKSLRVTPVMAAGITDHYLDRERIVGLSQKSSLIRVALALGISLVASAHERTITERAARKLVQEALVAMGGGWSSAKIEPWKFYWAPEFYTFSAFQSGVLDSDGRGVLQSHYFAVNPWTGDVWEGVGCERITSLAIQKDQESIWKRSRIPDEARKAIGDRSPADCSIILGTHN